VAALVGHLKHTFDVANHIPKHVCAADNADQHAVAQDEHALDPVLHHEVTQIRERGVLMEMTGARMMSRTRHWVATDRSAPLELQRQVQIAAGSIVLVTTVLGLALSPWFFAPTAFVGAGLITAGATGFCGMAHVLTRAMEPCNLHSTNANCLRAASAIWLPQIKIGSLRPAACALSRGRLPMPSSLVFDLTR
jgi:hypothetical protein